MLFVLLLALVIAPPPQSKFSTSIENYAEEEILIV
jgi:hypothetical protein